MLRGATASTPCWRNRRFGLYVITHPDAAGIIIRVSDNRWFYARQCFPERWESPADFTPDRCTELIRTDDRARTASAMGRPRGCGA